MDGPNCLKVDCILIDRGPGPASAVPPIEIFAVA
jgi:hypothetical protein